MVPFVFHIVAHETDRRVQALLDLDEGAIGTFDGDDRIGPIGGELRRDAAPMSETSLDESRALGSTRDPPADDKVAVRTVGSLNVGSVVSVEGWHPTGLQWCDVAGHDDCSISGSIDVNASTRASNPAVGSQTSPSMPENTSVSQPRSSTETATTL